MFASIYKPLPPLTPKLHLLKTAFQSSPRTPAAASGAGFGGAQPPSNRSFLTHSERRSAINVNRIVRKVYREAGYGKRWYPNPKDLRIAVCVCQDKLPSAEADIRPYSDDQNIVIGYACGDERTNYLPTAHWVAWHIGKWIDANIRSEVHYRDNFGPDFKVLVSLNVDRHSGSVSWNHIIISVQHTPGLQSEEQHRQLIPLIEDALNFLEKSGIKGALSTWDPRKLILNGAGEFVIGGPEGDNGLSGKKLVIDHYGSSVPIGGGALSGKDPHKVDKCGPLRARQLAKRLVREGVDEATITLGWAPGGDTPFLIEALTVQGGVRIQVPREELPPDKWFSINRIVGDLELAERNWQADLLDGYFVNPNHSWER